MRSMMAADCLILYVASCRHARTILDINLGLYLVICSYLLTQLSATSGILDAYSLIPERHE